MTKRTRALAGLTAGVLAVSAMAFGFSKWSSDVDLNGTVSANGKWEVAVTAADASISSTGAEMEKINTESSYTVVTYPVYVDYRASSGYYSFRIGDDEAAETKISYTDFTTNYEKNTAKWIGVSTFGSGARSGDYTFMLNVADEYKNIVEEWWNRSSLKATDDGASDGKQIGTAIAWLYKGRSTNTPDNDKIKLTWDAANTYFAANGTTTATAQITDNAVTYAPVTFTLPEAWANYKVTVTNNGTVTPTCLTIRWRPAWVAMPSSPMCSRSPRRSSARMKSSLRVKAAPLTWLSRPRTAPTTLSRATPANSPSP